MLLEYVKNEKGQKIGLVIAVDRDIVGWSRCNIKKDRFDKEMGLNIAMGRALNGWALFDKDGISTTLQIQETLDRIRERSHHYFKVHPEEFDKLERQRNPRWLVDLPVVD